jgi:site-specific recombinase XerD
MTGELVPVDHAALDAATVGKLSDGIPEATRRAYAAGRADWMTWCQTSGKDSYPVHPETLARYTTFLLDHGTYIADPRRPLSVASVEQRLSAISTGSVEAGWGKPDMRPARLVIKGHKRQRLVKQKEAAPITVAVLRALVAQAMSQTKNGNHTLRAHRDRCLILLGFATMARRSELVRIPIEGLADHPEGMTVQVLRTKTDDDWRTVRVLYGAQPELCPVRATRAYKAALATLGVTTGPLMRAVDRWDKPRKSLTGESVAERLRDLAVEAGVEVPDGFGQWSGHSLRRGAATEARRHGADRVSVADNGGWSRSSRSLDRYFADVDGWEQHPLKGVL